MIKNLIGILGAATFAIAPIAAQAQEINSDTGFDNPGAWMADTGWSVTGGKAVATGVNGLDMLHQMTAKIKKGRRYRVTFTVQNRTDGAVRPFVGITMPSPTPGSWITAASTPDIADNFTYSAAIRTDYTPKASYTGPGDSAEAVGAFRFGGGHGKFGWIDPLVNPGVQSSHLHEFICNTDVREDWDFQDFRTKGSSTCGNTNDPTHAVNRSGYWNPAMLDGNGNMIRIGTNTVYYKGAPNPALSYGADPYGAAGECAVRSPTVNCQNIPTGLRMIAGYNAYDNSCGPADTLCNGHASYGFDCWTQAQVQSPRYATIEAARNSGHASCTIGNSLRAFIDMPSCWDGVNIDSPNHRDHMSYPTSGATCPMSHPVAIPVIAIMNFYMIDQAFLDGKWRLSMDEMKPGAVAGSTLHFDYWEAWSPTARQTWYDKCILSHNSCSLEFGDNTGLKNSTFNFDGTATGGVGQSKKRPDKLVPTRLYGMGKDYIANGTYVVDITAPGNGVFGFMGTGGFTGQIDNVTIVEIGTAKGPVTVSG